MKKMPALIMCVVFMAFSGCITQPEGDTPSGSENTVLNVFDTPWDDYTFFYDGLIRSEQGSINQLKGATIYHIDVDISDDCLLLQGHQDVCYTNQEDEVLNEVYFRLFPNIGGGSVTVSSVTVDGLDVEPVLELQASALRVPLPAGLDPGEQVVICMDFDVHVAQDMAGNYGLFGYFNNVLVLDEFYPVIPVYDDEKWNVEVPPPHGDVTYYDVSFYLVRVTAPVKLKIATSGIEIGRIEESGNQVFAVAAGPARDFYLAASTDYITCSSTLGETTVNSYALAGYEDSAELALQVAVNAVRGFSQRFGVYPYTEFDVVSTPMMAKGMEYPGIVAISEELYVPGAVVSGLPSHVLLESVLAHETAHQWFYNTVGNDQLDEPWLDEAVVQYATNLYYIDVYGEAAAQEYRSSWEGSWGLIENQDIPIGLSSSDYAHNEYVPIIYGRGPLFLVALAEAMGQGPFDEFLRDYYETYKWGIGTGDAFRQLAEEHCQCDLTSLFEEWVY